MNLKYYTAFTFPDPALHCTHRYLGKLNEFKRDDVIATIDTYMLHGGLAWPQIDFTIPEMFGPMNDVRVLTPSMPVTWPKPWAELRAHLAQFGQRDDYDYRPHVSTKLPSVTQPITGYGLFTGPALVRVWTRW